MDKYNVQQLFAILFMLPVIYMLNSMNPQQIYLMRVGIVTTLVVGIIAILYIEISIWGPRRYKKALLELEEHKKQAIKKIKQMKEDEGFSLFVKESIDAIEDIEDPKFSIQVDDLKVNVDDVVKRFICENTPEREGSFFENIINNGIHAISDNVTADDVFEIGRTLILK